ncbi:MAG TPA: M81 family metallopeptidase, partial [Chthonomonadaceae bacterium]|nr:M81 family metallopeptidase [Chthonomonadaceae bacterium]
MRILTGGVMHETSTFASDITTIRNFEAGKGIVRGAAMLELFRGANFCGGGFLEGAERHGFTFVPVLWTFATPSGLIERAAYDALKAEFLTGVEREKANGFDGILL